MDVANARSAGSTHELVSRYGSLCLETVRQLQYELTNRALDELVLSDRYRLIMMTLGSDAAGQLVDLELALLQRRFADAAKAVNAEIQRWGTVGWLIVPDTNVLLHVLDNDIDRVGWRDLAGLPGKDPIVVVIPMVVVDELDRLKRSGKDAVRTRARVTIRAIHRLLDGDPQRFASIGEQDGTDRLAVFLDSPGHVRMESADSEIIDRAVALMARAEPRVHSVDPEFARPVRLLTADQGMALRAGQAGLTCRYLEDPTRPGSSRS